MRKRGNLQDESGASGLPSNTINLSLESPLSFVERLFYWSCYIGLIIYATYRVYLASNEYEEYLPAYSFNPGWSFIGRQQDISNFEWSFWTRYWFPKIFPWMVGHILISRCVSIVLPQVKSYIFPIYGIVAVGFIMGWQALSLLLAHALVAYMSSVFTRSMLSVWIVGILLLSTLNFDPFSDMMKNLFDDDPYEYHYYLLIFTSSMMNIRYISFGLEVCRKPKPDQEVVPSSGLLDMLVYLFYFPLFFTGPLMTYNTFHQQVNCPPKPWNTARILEYAKTLVRLMFWWAFYEFSCHFIYFDAILQDTNILRRCSLWLLPGLGYLSGQFFMVKYVLMFGVPSLVAQIDDLELPAGPMCISRIYLYSQMWKCFDRGLYSFLKRHIYVPMGGSSYGIVRQLCGSFACFVFIYYWHGAEYYLLVWCLLNFIGIVFEAGRKSVGKLPAMQSYQFPFSKAMEQRLTALLSVMLLVLSTFGYFYFMGGATVGDIYARRLLDGGVATFIIAFSYYAQIQVSMDIELWEKTRKQ